MGIFDFIFKRKHRRRARVVAEPFPSEWRPWVVDAVPRFALYHDADKKALVDAIKIFLAEKEFRILGDLPEVDHIKVTVAAGACQLLLGIPELDIFPRLREVIVYPHHFTQTTEAIGPDGRPYQISQTRAGEAWLRGPVILAWDSVARSVASPGDGYNVVIHEFAHILDMQNGAADGIPPLATKQDDEVWLKVFFDEFRMFVADQRAGRRTLINPYGATAPAEFFAVASEHFFEHPERLHRHHPRVFDLMRRFYRPPATR